MEKYGVPGMLHPSSGINIQHNIEQPKGPHIPVPVNHTGHKTPSVHSHHSHNGMTHTPVQHMPTGNHHTSTIIRQGIMGIIRAILIRND